MTEKLHNPVVVVVPVYLGLQATTECIESLRHSDLPDGVSVLLINDASPDTEITQHCQKVADTFGFELWTNDNNLGFVQTVNRGFSYAENADVILLNSDTVVSGDWINRLQHCAYSDSRIGTVTPFSNNGTICSYPVFLEASPLPQSWNPQELDQIAAQVNRRHIVDIPTGVGFCLYIKRDCLREVGAFDAERFGHGYGEECDFSLRAQEKGWRNVAAADVFVFHEGGASFAEQSEPRKAKAEEIIARLHPHYQASVLAFIDDDPLGALRRAIDVARLQKKPAAGGEVLAEQERHHARTKAELQTRLCNAQQDIKEELQQKSALELLLQDCREQFAATDKALQEGHGMIAALREELQTVTHNLQQVSNTAHAQGEELEYRQHHIQGLEAKIATMEQSRSWRYTAWLRRGES